MKEAATYTKGWQWESHFLQNLCLRLLNLWRSNSLSSFKYNIFKELQYLYLLATPESLDWKLSSIVKLLGQFQFCWKGPYTIDQLFGQTTRRSVHGRGGNLVLRLEEKNPAMDIKFTERMNPRSILRSVSTLNWILQREVCWLPVNGLGREKKEVRLSCGPPSNQLRYLSGCWSQTRTNERGPKPEQTTAANTKMSNPDGIPARWGTWGDADRKKDGI